MILSGRISAYFSAQIQRPESSRLFSLLVYTWFIINWLLTFPYRQLLWGNDSVIARGGYADNLLENFFYNLIYEPENAQAVYWIHLAAIVLSFNERWWNFLPRFFVWVSGLMLYYAAFPAFNSGLLLMLLFSCYLTFSSLRSKNPYRISLDNFVRLACIIQVCMVYALAAGYKLVGTQWLQGHAIYYSLQIDHFSPGFLRSQVILQSSFLMKALNYIALVYQILFPVFVWVKRGRNWLLAAGVLFHLFTCVVMNLWDFGLAMIFSYALFVDEKLAGKILSKLNVRKALR